MMSQIIHRLTFFDLGGQLLFVASAVTFFIPGMSITSRLDALILSIGIVSLLIWYWYGGLAKHMTLCRIFSAVLGLIVGFYGYDQVWFEFYKGGLYLTLAILLFIQAGIDSQFLRGLMADRS